MRQWLTGSRVIPCAGLNLVILFTLDFQLPVASVEFGVKRCVAQVVLTAQFGGNLIERLFQLVELVADVDDTASGLLRELAHFSLPE